MTKAVLTTKANSGYDDVREERYHFPRSYLSRIQEAENDFIVYYEPRAGNGQGAYIAVARVATIEADNKRTDHYYARIVDYINFDNPVPFILRNHYFEKALKGPAPGRHSGAFQSAVRLLGNDEFELILEAGFAHLINPQNKTDSASGFAEEPMGFDRPIVEQVVRRPFRDAAFARQVKSAYSNRCAFTGLDMRNGGGRSEVDAAHIKPVGDGHNGPDSVRNGLALSKTIHWMFDRGLLSIDADRKILVAGTLVPEPVKRLLNPSGHAQFPDDVRDQPHQSFLDYHRNKIFKPAVAGS